MNKKVPLVRYGENGERIVIGEAVVTDIGGNLYARCLIEDSEAAALLRPAGGYSIGVDPGPVIS